VNPGQNFTISKLRYGISEVDNHKFNIYHRHHARELCLQQTSFDACFFPYNNTNHILMPKLVVRSVLSFSEVYVDKAEGSGPIRLLLLRRYRDRRAELAGSVGTIIMH
jgi:hypothetical protein